MELITKLGIDWKLLIAQIVNFLILLLVLYKFAFKPLVALLDERSRKVEKSLSDAEQIEKNLRASNEEAEKLILKARRESQKILNQSKKDAESLRQKLVVDAEGEVSKLISDGRKKIEQDREKMTREIKEEVADLVVEATRKVLLGTVDQKVNREYINKLLINKNLQ